MQTKITIDGKPFTLSLHRHLTVADFLSRPPGVLAGENVASGFGGLVVAQAFDGSIIPAYYIRYPGAWAERVAGYDGPCIGDGGVLSEEPWDKAKWRSLPETQATFKAAAFAKEKRERGLGA